MIEDDEFVDYPDPSTKMRRKKRAVTVYRCSWRYAETRVKCNFIGQLWDITAEHVLHAHFNGVQTHENEVDFYIVDEIIYEPTCCLPTKSHWDMVKPMTEDPEFQKQIRQPATPTQFTPQIATVTNPQGIIINDNYIPPSNVTAKPLKPGPPKSIPAYDSSNISVVTVSLGKLAHSPRRVRGETKKCRKVYGMEHKDLWCTQCKWKKACTRFND